VARVLGAAVVTGRCSGALQGTTTHTASGPLHDLAHHMTAPGLHHSTASCGKGPGRRHVGVGRSSKFNPDERVIAVARSLLKAGDVKEVSQVLRTEYGSPSGGLKEQQLTDIIIQLGSDKSNAAAGQQALDWLWACARQKPGLFQVASQ